MNKVVFDVRIKHSWDSIDKKTSIEDLAKGTSKTYKPNIYNNSDKGSKLLTVSRHSEMIHFSKWTHRKN